MCEDLFSYQHTDRIKLYLKHSGLFLVGQFEQKCQYLSRYDHYVVKYSLLREKINVSTFSSPGVIATLYEYIFKKGNKKKLSFYYIQIPSYFLNIVLSERGLSWFSNSLPSYHWVISNHQEVALPFFCYSITEIY